MNEMPDTPPSPTGAPAARRDPAVPAAPPLTVAVIGAGPVGLFLALLAARRLPQAAVTLFDARPLDKDVSGDPRTLALAWGTVQAFRQEGVWHEMEGRAALIDQVHVSQLQPAFAGLAGIDREPEVLIRAADLDMRHVGAVSAYGSVVAPLQRAWQTACESEPARLASRFGTPVGELKSVEGGVEVDAGVAERFDLAVVAEGGVFADQGAKPLHHDYKQTAWVGTVWLDGGERHTAFERFTPQGPLALLPLKPDDGGERAALVWCVPSHDDPVAPLDEGGRIAVLNAQLAPRAGRVVRVSPLKHFPLGLNAERTLVRGRQVRIGNAAQTLHPVAGQGMNLGLRDAQELVRALSHGRRPDGSLDVDAALRRVEWQRAPDRWALIATTDFLARSFTWDLPGLATLRGAALAVLERAGPLKKALARQMMYGRR